MHLVPKYTVKGRTAAMANMRGAAQNERADLPVQPVDWWTMSGLIRLLRTIFPSFVVAATVGSTLMASAAFQARQTASTSAAVDVTKLGPQVGQKVPDFSLPDQHGQMRTLASLMGPKGLVLVFNRSADW
jgi:hypothetical protein